ncbi:MAG: thioredoxin [Thermodesulfobacteriota bacterium]
MRRGQRREELWVGIPKAWAAAFAGALALLGAGILLGEPFQVFFNAVSVCLSCLGVG